jgi:tripartite-type tricarboxylate transporter receptor subunit TctC
MAHVFLSAVLVLAVVLGSIAPAAAEYPERALTIVAAYPAGGMVDIVARPLAEGMKKKFPKGVAVLNRPGGGGSVGMAEVAQAKPDGYTVIRACLDAGDPSAAERPAVQSSWPLPASS